MKIWVIGRGYPTLTNRMRGSFEFEQAKMLSRAGHDVSYLSVTLSFFTHGDPRGLWKHKEEDLGIFTYSQFYFPGKFGINIGFIEDWCWKTLFKQVEAVTGIPDIIHIHYPSLLTSINEIEKYRLRGVNVFVTEHWSSVLNGTLRKHEARRLKYYSKYSRCVICVGDELLKAVDKQCSLTVPSEVIPNTVSSIFFNVPTESDESEDFVFVAIGRAESVKQFDTIIQQFLLSFSSKPHVKLKIIGEGKEMRHLKQLAKGSSQIIFTGELLPDDVANELNKSNVLVSYSKYETFALPVAEAWACGKPCIVSDTAGITTYFSNEVGMVVSNDKPEELGEAMKTILLEYSKYSNVRISMYAKEKFGNEAVVNSLNEVYLKYIAP